MDPKEEPPPIDSRVKNAAVTPSFPRFLGLAGTRSTIFTLHSGEKATFTGQGAIVRCASSAAAMVFPVLLHDRRTAAS